MEKMKLWYIPWPWDYREQGGIVVMAESKEKAIELGKVERLKPSQNYKKPEPNWDACTEAGEVYVDEGWDG